MGLNVLYVPSRHALPRFSPVMDISVSYEDVRRPRVRRREVGLSKVTVFASTLFNRPSDCIREIASTPVIKTNHVLEHRHVYSLFKNCKAVSR